MTIRQTIASNLLENSPESIRHVRQMIKSDGWAYIIFDDELENIRIEKYLDGSMPERMMRAFEKMIKNDERLARKFNLRKRVHEKIYQVVPLLGPLEEAHQAFEEKYRNKEFVLKAVPKTGNRKRTLVRWSVAASIALLLGLGLLYNFSAGKQLSNDELFAAYYQPFKPERGKTYNARSENVTEAKEKYLQKDYHNSYTIFLNLPDNINISLEKNFFLGLNLIEMGDYNGAIHHFESTWIENVGYLPEVNWFLGLCYIKTDQNDKATEALTRLVNSSDYRKSEARKLLLFLN
jgi:hypothetical protein